MLQTTARTRLRNAVSAAAQRPLTKVGYITLTGGYAVKKLVVSLALMGARRARASANAHVRKHAHVHVQGGSEEGGKSSQRVCSEVGGGAGQVKREMLYTLCM